MITKIELNNFRSFLGKHTIDLTTNNCFLILGNNLDDSGSDSNSSGKSNLALALYWGYFGTLPSIGSFANVTVADVITYGQKSCYVKIYSDEGLIHRSRTSNQTKLDCDFLSEITPTDQQAALTLLLFGTENQKLARTIFETTHYMTSYTSSLLTLDNSTRIQLISDLLNLSRWKNLLLFTREEYNKVKSNLENLESDLEKIQEEQSRVDVKDLENRKTKIDERIKYLEELKLEVVRYEQQVRSDEQARIQLSNQIIQLTNSVTEIKNRADNTLRDLGNSYTEERQKYTAFQTVLDGLKNVEVENSQEFKSQCDAKVIELDEGVRNLEYELVRTKEKQRLFEKSLKCPECNTLLSLSDEGLILVREIDMSEEIKSIEEKLVSVLSQRLLFINRITKLDTLCSLSDSKTRLSEIESKGEMVKKERDDAVSQRELEVLTLKKKEESLKPKEQAFTPRESLEEIDNDLRGIREDLDSIQFNLRRFEERKKVISKLNSEIIELKKEENLYQFWIEGFGTIERWIIEAFIPVLSTETNKVLENLGVVERVNLSTLTEKSSGDGFKRKFSVLVWNGTKMVDIGIISSGKRQRVLISLNLGLRNLILGNGIKDLGILILDEILDSVDGLGIPLIWNQFKNMSNKSMVISHNNNLQGILEGQIIQVEKKNGCSEINLI